MSTVEYWQDILDNLLDAYKKLSSKEMSSVTIDGKTITYADRFKLLKEIRIAERKAGVSSKPKRLLESY